MDQTHETSGVNASLPRRWAPRAVLERKIRSAWLALRTNPRDFRRALIRIEHYVVYRADPRCVPKPDPIAGASIVKLVDQDLRDLPADGMEDSEQLAYLQRRGFNNAYAVMVNSTIAHISWIITSDLEKDYPIRNVKLRAREFEITHCVTREDYRGRGLYPFAIRSLCQAESACGFTKVFMITNIMNKASQRGMEKAGLARCGRIFRIVLPQFGNWAVTIRGHRWPRARSFSSFAAFHPDHPD